MPPQVFPAHKHQLWHHWSGCGHKYNMFNNFNLVQQQISAQCDFSVDLAVNETVGFKELSCGFAWIKPQRIV